jgi:pilus assembly protein CpaF
MPAGDRRAAIEPGPHQRSGEVEAPADTGQNGADRRRRRSRPSGPVPTVVGAAQIRQVPKVSVPDAFEELRSQILTAIHDRRLDPSAPPAVEAAVRGVVEGYQARARSGLGGRALADPARMIARLCQSVLEFGPLTRFITGDEVVEEVLIVGGDVLYVDREGRLAMLEEPIAEAEMRTILDRLLATAGASVDESNPMVQVQILDGQARLGVVIPPIADRLNASMRRYVLRYETLELLVEWGALTPQAASLLAASTFVRTGLLLTGQPSSGKTSLGNAILRAAPETLRVICCEDTPEVNPEHLSPFRWRTRRPGPDGSAAVSLRELVRFALGMRADLIVLGEVRGAEAYELTRAGNSGCGFLTTLHANSARAGLQALMSTAVMAGQNVDAAQIRSVFANIVDLVVHLEREPLAQTRAAQGRVRRQVMEIAAVPPLQGSESDFAVEPIFVRDELGGPLRWTGAPLPDDLRVRLDRALRPRGFTVQRILEGKDVLV